ncbi:MAG: hypothetical protein GPOALKHO_000477 [Sodalis sp.]|nr:MAG: hypothetical protein GPOALKHO_000477 [Sodalis sp.]
MEPATSYALEPFSEEASVASALNSFVQMASAAALVSEAEPSPAVPARS